MIFNLSEYVRLNTAYTPITNGLDPETTGDALLLIGSGGEDLSRGLIVEDTVQFISRFADRIEAYLAINSVNNLLKNRFSIELPQVIVDSVTYPAITVAQITPLQRPGYVGADSSGLHQWSVNYKVITRED